MSKGDGDKRSVSTDALETLGNIIDVKREKRDAIHLAVEPTIAPCRLFPGQHVDAKGQPVLVAGAGVGIVDPFVLRPIEVGEGFWLVIYPREIHSLRHAWTHPAFPDVAVAPEVFEQPAGRKARSEAYLRALCERSDWEGPDYDKLLIVATNGGKSVNTSQGERDDDYFSAQVQYEYFHIGGHDAHGEVPPEIWDHIEIVTGKKCPMRPAHFSCSC